MHLLLVPPDDAPSLLGHLEVAGDFVLRVGYMSPGSNQTHAQLSHMVSGLPA